MFFHSLLIDEEMQVKRLEKVERQALQGAKVRFNTTISGLPAYWILEWQRMGLIRSKSDALRQALIALKEKFSTLEAKPSSESEDYE
jgi:hypothetical protein